MSRLILASALACLIPLDANAQDPAITATTDFVCAGKAVTLSSVQGSNPVAATWSASPSGVAAIPSGPTTTATLTAPAAVGTTAVYGTVVVTADQGGNNRPTKKIVLGGICELPFGGELTRATVGFEQIGASGIESSQKYAFDFYISRPFPLGAQQSAQSYFLGLPARWWGEVRVASYPQQVTSEAASFASGFVASASKLTVNKLVQSAEFTTGVEFRIAGTDSPVRSDGDYSRQRFALMLFGGVGAVGPFPLATEDPPVFEVPADQSPQLKAFQAANPGVSAKFVAFRPQAPDRFLGNASGGLRLYTHYVSRTATGEPLKSAPAMVSVAFGKNRLIAPDNHNTWHVSAYYPFAFGDRGDASSIIVYLFGNAWMALGSPQFSAPAYQLKAAVEDGKPIAATDPRVAIITVSDKPRDTYRIGLGIDLLTVWKRLNKNGDEQ